MDAPFRRARVRLAGLPPSSEREVEFVYRADFGRYCSDAIVAVSRGRHGREVYAAALGVPERAFTERMELDEEQIRRFRGLEARIVAWAERPELGWRGFTPTADPSLWDHDWVALAQRGETPELPLPDRPHHISGPDLAAVIADLVADAQLLATLQRNARRAGFRASATWLSGGCLLLAEGARRALGGTLFGVVDNTDCDCGDLDHHAVEHVALRLRDGRCLDSQGLHADEAALLAGLRRLSYRSPAVVPFSLGDARPLGLFFDPSLALDLERRIRLDLAAR